MKTASRLRRVFALAAISLAAALPARALIVTESATYNPNLLIPDGSTVGVVDSRNFTSTIATITQVRVSLSIAGTPGAGDTFNGDFYVTLAHSSGFAVLLNRAGRTAVDPFGYADSGFNVTFDDAGAFADIHNYQLTLNPGGGTLTGTWGSDGRNVNANAVLDTTPRIARLDSFNGLDASGEWNLFVADVESLGTGRLVSWTLEVTGQQATPVPEPGSALAGMLCVAACCGTAMRRRRGAQIG
jgi:hypothetical protein